jgi:tetratricopeptide (TPR) repeat protein
MRVGEGHDVGAEDIFDSLRDGVGLAGRLAARSVGEVSRALLPTREAPPPGTSGLYFRRHLQPSFGRLLAYPEYAEYQEPHKPWSSLLKSLTLAPAERAFAQAITALFRGAYREARQRCEDAYLKDAQCCDAYFVYGALSLLEHDAGAAVHALKKVLLTQARLGKLLRRYLPSLRFTLCLTENSSFVLAPDLLGTTLLLAFAHRLRGDDEDACNVLDQLLGVMPADPVVHFFLAALYLEAGRYRQAIDLLRDTLADDNLSVASLVLLAKACLGQHDAATALEIYRKILTHTDFDPQLMVDVRYNMGMALAALGRKAEAETEFARISALYAGYVDLLTRLGLEQESRQAPRLTAASSRPAALPVRAERSARAPQVGPGSPSPTQQPRPAVDTLGGGAAQPAPDLVVEAAFELADEVPPDDFALACLDGRVTQPLGAETVIGSEQGELLVPWDSGVSPRHARVFYQAGDWWVEDLHSAQGTWVNGHRIATAVQIHRGDVVTVGTTRLRLS